MYEEDPEQWPDGVVREGTERKGSLVGTQSTPITGSGGGRRLLSTPFQRELNDTNLEVLPPVLQVNLSCELAAWWCARNWRCVDAAQVQAALEMVAHVEGEKSPHSDAGLFVFSLQMHPVVTDTSVTGQDVRLLMAPETMVRLFSAAGCQGEEHADVPANMDVCPGSLHQFYPSGARIESNFLSLSVPPGLAIDVSDACEFSQPPPSTTAGFHFGAVVGSGCDNRKGTAPICCFLPANSKGRMLRARAETKNVPTSLQILGNSWLKVYYSPVAGGRTKVVLRVEEVPIRDDSGQEVLRR